ncbi:MAG: sigma-54-dependent Fis family transcriptional regulator [Candidatus Tectomicrobia bacterium]|uniref:Sigma-54-dependent Fis family transcriptional regulator n=1 Tax=Tectimicrobiota bacterium TaxID=2528274 RepID=A0A932CQN7_UNCTE|nr:sigma-54-dependent Fis family transcriptional regulator [Candidatus Tectomicrobia bacterium]
MGKSIGILLVDDEEGFRETVFERLVLKGHQVTAAASAEAALAAARERNFEVAVVDILMPGMDGLTLLQHLKGQQPLLEVIMITGEGSIESAVDAMKRGAYHYLTKPVKLSELEMQIQKAQERGLLVRQNTLQQEELRLRRRRYGELVGNSEPIGRLLSLAERVAPSNCTVLIEGETGTGKEMIAHMIHRKGPRASRPFIVVNCGSLPEDLLERELFGHSRGAFTGATEARPGLIEVADGGTLLLDEIGEISLSGQVALLRVLETGLFRRLGETREVEVDVRVLAATNRHLSEAVQQGRFREDLYHRLNVVGLCLPPLRERQEDIPLLAQHFLERWAVASRSPKRLSHEALDLLLAYPGPGNVRELSNVVERACLVCDGEQILPEHRGLPGKSPRPGPAGGALRGLFTLREAERHHILWTLEALGGRVEEAAQSLGITSRHLYRKLAQYKEKREHRT